MDNEIYLRVLGYMGVALLVTVILREIWRAGRDQ